MKREFMEISRSRVGAGLVPALFNCDDSEGWGPKKSVCHADPAAVRTDPGGTVADAPEIFAKALLADLEAAGAVKTIGQLLLAAVADILFFAAVTAALFLLFHQDSSSSMPSIGCSGSLMTKVVPLTGFPSTWMEPW